MVLTLEEKKSVAKMVIESYQGTTISEAKTNISIREEITLNLEFYNAVKEGFVENIKGKKIALNEAGWVSAVLSAIGNVKDFLTGTKIIKNISAWIADFLEKIGSKLMGTIEKYIPSAKGIIDGLKQGTLDSINGVKEFSAWLYKTLSYKGLAKVFAMIRYKTFRPTDEQKKCMELAAQKTYKWILITLVAAFVIKFAIILLPAIKAAIAAGTAVKGGVVLASLSPLKATLLAIGHGTMWKGILSSISALLKGKQVSDIKGKIESEEDKAKNGELDNFKGAWNSCPIESERKWSQFFDKNND